MLICLLDEQESLMGSSIRTFTRTPLRIVLLGFFGPRQRSIFEPARHCSKLNRLYVHTFVLGAKGLVITYASIMKILLLLTS